MDPVSLDHLLSSSEVYTGSEVVTSGRLLSYSAFEFWLVTGQEDIPIGRGIRLVHPDLDILLFENVPALGGRYSFYHPATVAGTLRLMPERIPTLEIEHLTRLVVTAGPRTYELI